MAKLQTGVGGYNDPSYADALKRAAEQEPGMYLFELVRATKPGGGAPGEVTTSLNNSTLERMEKRGFWCNGKSANKVALSFLCADKVKMQQQGYTPKSRWEKGVEVVVCWQRKDGTAERKMMSVRGAVGCLGDFRLG